MLFPLHQDTQLPGTTLLPAATHLPAGTAATSHHTATLDIMTPTAPTLAITHTADTDMPQHMPDAPHMPAHTDPMAMVATSGEHSI